AGSAFPEFCVFNLASPFRERPPMLVKIPPTKTSCPLVTTLRTSLFGAGFHVRSTVPFGLTRTKLFRVTSLTEVKNPAMITFPSSWTAMSRTKPPLDSFKFGNAAGEVCARTDESWKQKINAITPVMVRLIRPLTVALKLWEKPTPRHLIPFVFIRLSSLQFEFLHQRHYQLTSEFQVWLHSIMQMPLFA